MSRAWACCIGAAFHRSIQDSRLLNLRAGASTDVTNGGVMDEQSPPTEEPTPEGETAPERRDRKADERDVALDAREDRVLARETAEPQGRDLEAQANMDVANERDVALDAREDRCWPGRPRTRIATRSRRPSWTKLTSGTSWPTRATRSADARDQAASLHSFIHDEDGSSGIQARRSAGLDRSDAKADRTQSAEDRSKLAGGAPAGAEETEA